MASFTTLGNNNKFLFDTIDDAKIRSDNCRKFSPASKRHPNWEPIHQNLLRGTINPTGQLGYITNQEFPSIL